MDWKNCMTEHRIYVLFDRITPRLRNIVSALLIGTGFLFQLSSRNILVGLPFIIACLILNLMKSISIDRMRAKKYNWQQVTPEKINEVLSQCKRIKKFRSNDIGYFVGFFIFLVFFLTFGVPLLKELPSVPFPLIATVINAIILFCGLSLSGRRRAWIPRSLDIKTEIVKRILESDTINKDPTLQVIPYLEIGETKEGTFPTDSRLLVKFKDGPPDFIGIQAQISINSVKSRDFPYFYVVLLAKSAFNLFEKLGRQTLDKLVIEPKKTAEVDVIVIRQRTTKTSGYHTNTKAQDYILTNSIALAKQLF